MTQLKEQKCVPCSGNAPRASDNEIEEWLKELPGWKIEDEAGVPRLVKTYRFPDFAAALAFTNRIGQAAEEQEHHPAILTEYGKVTVSWWTHKIKGLHRNDFIMAAKTDELAQQ